VQELRSDWLTLDHVMVLQLIDDASEKIRQAALAASLVLDREVVNRQRQGGGG
jgi:hypothetical protein